MQKKLPRKAFILICCLVINYSVVLRGAIGISIPNMNSMQGTNIEIPVLISGLSLSDSLVAYQMKVRFNATVLQCNGATESGTMTVAWGVPYFGISSDTLRVGGMTTNQPNKRIVQDDGILVKLKFLVIGYPGSNTTLSVSEIKCFNLDGEMSIGSVTNGTFTVTQNPASVNVDITLYTGWNLISFPVFPIINTLPQILQGVLVNYIIGYYPPGGYLTWAASSTLNPLNKLDGFHGYWMRLNSASSTTLRFTGVPIGVTSPINMVAGWNLISYFPPSPDKISHSLASIDPYYVQVLGYQAGSGYITWARGRPLNFLNTLTPTFGYWVKMDASASLVYPASGYSVLKTFYNSSNPSRNVSATDGIPQICDFWAFQLNVFNLGDTVSAWNQHGLLCGTTVVQQKDMFLISALGDDPNTPEVEGAVQGEEVLFTINHDSTVVMGTSANLDSVIVPGKPATWEVWGSKRVQLKKIEGTSLIAYKELGNVLSPSDFLLVRNYPNPFNACTSIAYQLGREKEITIRIYDVSGRLVKTMFNHKMHQAGLYRVLWDATNEKNQTVPSGIYICRIEAGERKTSLKMMLLY